MSALLHRRLDRDYPQAVAGDGVYLVAADGRRFLDASGGAAVSILGHSEKRVVEAVGRQVDELAFAHSAFFTTDPAERLADQLAKRAGLDHVALLGSGSESIEAAIKLSRQHWVASGEGDRSIYLARHQSYHGATLGALGIGGNRARREPFLPLLAEAHLVAPCYAYRDRADSETPAAYAERLAAELESEIECLGAHRVAGFIVETVGGATVGAIPPVADYLERVRAICDRFGVHLILDEVMCGMGRTGSFFAFEQEFGPPRAATRRPDLVAIGKGLGAGYQPISAVLARDEIVAPLFADGAFQHGQTFMAHPVAAAAACATLDVLDADGLIDRVAERGRALQTDLRQAFGNHPHVGDIRGRGLLLAMEFVRDRDSKTPFPAAERRFRRLQDEAMARELLCYTMGGTVDGTRGDHVLIAPPYILSGHDQHALIERLSDAVDAAFR